MPTSIRKLARPTRHSSGSVPDIRLLGTRGGACSRGEIESFPGGCVREPTVPTYERRSCWHKLCHCARHSKNIAGSRCDARKGHAIFIVTICPFGKRRAEVLRLRKKELRSFEFAAAWYVHTGQRCASLDRLQRSMWPRALRLAFRVAPTWCASPLEGGTRRLDQGLGWERSFAKAGAANGRSGSGSAGRDPCQQGCQDQTTLRQKPDEPTTELIHDELTASCGPRTIP
ncbi:hypothetical protein GQ53DRAFT_208849 [Thozetella sp. PMI_491]|nr:hypothetical protein GQ53DRAFT_208849 [Thozetella sp. PMI_491]